VDRCRPWGFTLQSLSPPQSRTPDGADALLPFLTSRSPALRTRRSRCPATSGLCSLRRSVPASSLRARADALLGFLAPEASLPVSRRPVARSPPRARDRSRRIDPFAEAWAKQESPTSMRPNDTRGAFTRTCPRALPTTVASRRKTPTGSERTSDLPTDRPEGLTDPVLRRGPGCRFRGTRRRSRVPGVTPGDSPSPHTTLSKKSP
jgi:hypothetical protein